MITFLKNTFLSHKGNNHRPHIFKEGVIIAFLFIALGICVGGLSHHIVLVKSDSLAAVYAEALVKLANKDREKHDLNELSENPLLIEAARLKAEDMALKGYFAHYGPDGTAPWDWIQKAGYRYVVAGENLAVNFTDSKNVEKAWMNSPTHRANILGSYTEIGIATAVGIYKGKEAIFVVQMFGMPKASSTPLALQGASVGDSLSVIEEVLTNPGTIIMMLYAILFIVISFGILSLIFSEYRKHHVRHMILVIALLLTIVSLAWIYTSALPGIVIA